MKLRRAAWLLGVLLLVPGASRASSPANVPVLSDAEAWKRMPPAEEGGGQRLPVWIRALAGTLPKTAAAMIDLDHAQRLESPLPPRLRAKLRWVAADANRCDYGRAYARFDYRRAGADPEDLDHLWHRLDRLPEAERLAVRLVRQLAESAYTVEDSQVTRLAAHYGDKQVVAIVLLAAYACFQDRLLLALGVSVEPDGPLPPVKARFRKPPPSDKSAASKTKKPPRKVSPPSKDPPPLPEKIDDPEWTAIPYQALKEKLKSQVARPRARLAIPTWEAVRPNLPEPLRQKPMRIKWSLLAYGYQPRLTTAWLGGLRAFREESDLDPVFHESMFWVVTRSLQCFY